MAARYANAPEHTLPQPVRWPKQATLVLAEDRPTLVLALHPHCSCSRATLEELDRLLAHTSTPLQVEVLLYQPDRAANSWLHTDTVSRARLIPGISIQSDRNGLESARFGLSVSGQSALYSPEGRLLFSGGLTAARGHVGDNAGVSSIAALVAHHRPAAFHTAVFGCSIQDKL